MTLLKMINFKIKDKRGMGMSKKITSYEELLKKGKECEALIEIRKNK